MKNVLRVLMIAALLFSFVACGNVSQGNTAPVVGDAVRVEGQQTEENQARLAKVQPPPRLQKSLERENLIRRLEFLNKEGTVGYVALISYGNIMGYYAVKGKVSSLNSFLTTDMAIVKDPFCHEAVGETGCGSLLLPSPDLDGSYGQNDDGIFFFTTDNVYVEWNDKYLYSSQPLTIKQPVQLQQNIEGGTKVGSAAPAR